MENKMNKYIIKCSFFPAFLKKTLIKGLEFL